MKKFIEENWFKIVIVLFLFLLSIVVIKISDYDCFDNFKFFIGFVNKNLSGIVFLIFLLCFIYYIIYCIFHNYFIRRKYKRDNNDKKFKTMRCREDGDEKGRYNVYLIDEESTPKTYQLIVDYYTRKELGYGGASRKDNLFSKNDYEIGNRIKIYNTIFDVKKILELKDKI